MPRWNTGIGLLYILSGEELKECEHCLYGVLRLSVLQLETMDW